MRRIIFVSLLACILSFVAQLTVSESTGATMWEDGSSVISRHEIVDYRENSYPCTAEEYGVDVQGYGMVERACIFGSLQEMRLARFVGGNVYRYAVSFPGKAQFYEVEGLCDNSPSCVYSPVSDVVLTHHYVYPYSRGAGLYKHFSKSLVRKFDVLHMKTYFMFQPERVADYIPRIQGGEPAVEAMVLSKNGKWAVLEMKYFGFIRVNTETLEARRIIAPGAQYGLFADPRFDMTITDDGVYFVGTGWNTSGVAVVTISDTCGDRLEQVTGDVFTEGTTRCKSYSVDTSSFDANLMYFQRPRFAANNQRLSITAFYRTGNADRIVVGIKGTFTEEKFGLLGLGDSFSSGEGELDDGFYKQGTNSTFLKCHTSTRSYAYILAEQWGMRAESVACSGARTVDILGGPHYVGQQPYLASLPGDQQKEAKKHAQNTFQPGVVSQLSFVEQTQPAVITVGIGGNDAGLIGKLQACVGLDSCEWVSDPAKRLATAKEIGTVYYSVRSVLRAVKTASPASKIYLVGYPQLIDSVPNAKCDTVLGALLNREERVFMNEAVKYLNQVLLSAAQYERVHFVTTENAFFDHELCGRVDSNAMNGIRSGDDISPLSILEDFKVIGSESFHPTPIGHRSMAIVIYDQLGPFAVYDQCQYCVLGSEIPELPEYWTDEAAVNSVVQREEPHLTADTLQSNKEMRIGTQRMLFEPGSKVTISLHSKPYIFGDVLANEEGVVTATYTLPATIPPGYHVLHLEGASPDGERIDVYKTVAVTKEESPADTTAETTQEPAATRQDSAQQKVEPSDTLIQEQEIEQQSQPAVVFITTLIPTVDSLIKSTAVRANNIVSDASAQRKNSLLNTEVWIWMVVGVGMCVFVALLLRYLFKVRV